MITNIVRKLSVLALLAILLLPAYAFAQEAKDPRSNQAQRQKYDRVNAAYNLKPVKTIPNGIQPIKVNSPEELEAYILDLQNQPVHTSIQDKRLINQRVPRRWLEMSMELFDVVVPLAQEPQGFPLRLIFVLVRMVHFVGSTRQVPGFLGQGSPLV